MVTKAMAAVTVIACALVVIMTTGCTSQTTPPSNATPSPSAHALSKIQARTMTSSQLGQAIQGDLVFSAQTVAVAQQIGNTSPAGGYSAKFIGCDITITNTGTTDQSVYTVASSLLDQLGDPRSVTVTLQGEAPITTLRQKITIHPKESVHGIILFEIPSSSAYTWTTLQYSYRNEPGVVSNQVNIPLK